MKNEVFNTKYDWWIVALIVVPILLLFLYGIKKLAICDCNNTGAWYLMGISLAMAVIIRIFAWPVNYILKADKLIVKSGFFRIPISYEAIKSVEPSRNPVSSPAWSLNRLKIEYEKKGKKKWILISPKDREVFLETLKSRAPNLS